MRDDQQQPAKPGMPGRGSPEGRSSLPSEGQGSQEDAKSETLSEAAEDIARQWDTAVQPRQRAAEAQSGRCCPDWPRGTPGTSSMGQTCWLAAEAWTGQPCQWPPEPPLPAPAVLSAALLPLRALSRCWLASPGAPLADAEMRCAVCLQDAALWRMALS